MSDSYDETVLESALELASMGFKIFPVHGIVNGKCTCLKACKHPGKHPRIKKNLDLATTNPEQIKEWFLKRFTHSNIGIATGKKSGTWVLDVDYKSGGKESLEKLIEEHGIMTRRPAETLTVQTGGGIHYYFKYPKDIYIPSSVGKLAPGLDIRGVGGYVIGPGSLHQSGKIYEWKYGPDSVKLCKASRWLIQKIKEINQIKKNRPSDLEFDNTFKNIVEGSRNITLFSTFACHLRDKNISQRKVEVICLALNQYSCKPPLEEEEVVSAVQSAFTFSKRPSRTRGPSDSSVAIYDLLRFWSSDQDVELIESSIREISSQIGISISGVRKCLKQLEQLGYIQVQEYSGRPSKYRVLFPSNDI